MLKKFHSLLLVILLKSNAICQNSIDILSFENDNMISDTIFDENGLNKTVNYYSLDNNSNKIYRGCKNFNRDTLYESNWISESNLIIISQIFFNNGKICFMNITLKGVYIQTISFHENGKIRMLKNFNPDGVQNGWSFEYDESGILLNQTLYCNGLKINTKKKKYRYSSASIYTEKLL